MFDAEGTDAGYEWVEIKNIKDFSIDLKNYKFCEGGSSISCRSWKDEKNSSYEIEKNSLAIITDDREKFLEKHSFDGLILVTSGFILTNTGENIQIKNPDGDLDDALQYYPSGAKDGETISVFENIWKKSTATPGSENIEKKDIGSSSDSKEENIHTSYVEVSSDEYQGKEKIKAQINEVGVVMAGAKTKISSKAYGLSGVQISGIDFFWNLGDGQKDYGSEIFHEFIFPGEYVITLVAKSGKFTGDDKLKIKVVHPPIEISQVRETKNGVEGFIKIKNNSREILNLSGWIILVDGDEFEIPEGSFVDKNSENIFPNRVTDLMPKNNKEKKSKIFLKFPSGEKFYSYSFDKKEVSMKAPIENKIEDKKTEIKIVEKIVYVEKEKEDEWAQKIASDCACSNTDSLQCSVETNSENFFNPEEYSIKKYSLKSSEDFVKDQWPFLTFIFIIGVLIISIFYIKKKEGFAMQNSQKTEEEIYEEDIKRQADQYEIEEILDK